MPDSCQDRLFTQLNPIPRSYPYLTDHVQTDTAIVGGGVTGALVAHALSNAGVSTLLTDRCALGYGQSGTSAPVMLYDGEAGLCQLLSKLGLRDAVEAMRVLCKAVSSLRDTLGADAASCGFSLKKGLTYTADAQEAPRLRGEYELRARNGFQVEWLDAAAASSRFGFPVAGGILSQEGCAQADPYRLTQHLVQQAVGKGLQVYENTDIVRLQPLPDSVLLHTNLGKTIRAQHVVLAAGAQASLGLQGNLSPVRVFGVGTQPLGPVEGWADTAIARDLGEDTTLLSLDGRALLLGLEVSLFSRHSRWMRRMAATQCAARYMALEQMLRARLPLVENMTVDKRFSGLITRSATGLPVIAPLPGAPRILSLAGYGQNAILAGAVAGRIAVDWVHGQTPEFAQYFKA